jgi:NAD+ diphosphatase
VQNYNVFAGAFVDRSGERRKDPDWLARAAQSNDCRFVPIWNDKCLVGGDPLHAVLLERRQVGSLIDDDHLIFLGVFRGHPAFAFALNNDARAPFGELGEFQDLRFLGTVLPPDEANLIAHARALVLWHGTQLFCGICGSSARPESGGNTRICVNPDCAREVFPRVDPAIIVLVSNGDRCFAGFAEPGESLEDAVRREVYEETNVHVGDVQYHSSQPWPFPSSLMLGFTATATATDIRLNDAELEHAQWFTRKELRSGFPKLPFRISIARRLVDHWIALDG